MPKNYIAVAISFLILFLMGALMLLSILNDAPTADEPPHILSGYTALKFGQDYIDPEHPLLAKTLASVPLLFQDIKFNQDDPGYLEQKTALDIGAMFAASQRFLTYSGNNPDGILFATRIPMILLTISFGIIIFLFTRKLFGGLAAIFATFFYATEPNILAHGRLVNTDLAGTGFILASIFALLLYFEHQSLKRLLFLILAISGALLSKYSTFFIFPLVIVLMGAFYLRRPVRPWLHILLTIFGVLICISIFYGLLSFPEKPCVGFFPCQYFKGLMIVQYELAHDTRFAYLIGHSYYGSRLDYFPILILAKTQIILLASFLISLFLIVFKKLRLSLTNLILVLLPPFMFFGLSLTTKFNIGVRHNLPIYPFLMILGAGAIAILIRGSLKNCGNRVGLIIAGIILFIVLGSRIWSVGTTFPGFLSYYNFLFGGSENGWKIANDSNYDWGQDVKRLADYVKENNIESIAYDNYTGSYSAEYYNIPVTRISPKDTDYTGYLALSTSVITFHEDKPYNYAWVVDHYKPTAKAGYSIFIYKIE